MEYESPLRRMFRFGWRLIRMASGMVSSSAAAILRGRWLRYTIFSGTNTWGEGRTALACLFHRFPLLDGPAIEAYEREFAAATDSTFAISFAAGRMALYALLEALDVGPGDEVLLPAFTCAVVPNAILYREAVPVYVDVSPRTFNVDVRDLEGKITERARVIIAQHTYGKPCDVEAIARLAAGRGIAVVEDCAHALGASHRGRKAGSLCRAAFHSTDHSKIICTGTGGMVTTNDAALAARVRALQQAAHYLHHRRVRGILWTLVAEMALMHPLFYTAGSVVYNVLWGLGVWTYFHDDLRVELPEDYPFPARLSNAQALIGLSQLKRLPGNISWRRRLARIYASAVRPERECSGLNEDAWLRYTFLVKDQTSWEEAFRGQLDMGIWFKTIAGGRLQDFHEIGYAEGSCPRAEFITKHCVNFPTHERIKRPHGIAETARALVASGDPRYELLDATRPCAPLS